MKCQQCKSIENLYKYKSSTSKTGFSYICRECNTNNKKKYRQTKKGKISTNKAVYKSIKKYNYKQNARTKVFQALKNGIILKPDICSVCKNKEIIEGHHMDYSKPLEVVWLCRKCHSNLHNIVI